MPLEKIVLLRNVNNLTEARYAAGMGVQYLGFDLHPNQPHHLPKTEFDDIQQWVVGPNFLGQYDQNDPQEALTLCRHYPLKCLEAPAAIPPPLPDIEHLFLKHTLLDNTLAEQLSNSQKAHHTPSNTLYHTIEAPINQLLHHWEALLHCSQQHSLLIAPQTQPTYALTQKLIQSPLAGIVLHGSDESRSGWKEFETQDTLDLLSDH